MPSISIVIPCLNEAKTLLACIQKAKHALLQAGMMEPEVIVADNGSHDGSQEIAEMENALVVRVPIRGYGSALHAGIMHASQQWVLFADADASYDFAELTHFLPAMNNHTDLIVGNRFAGNIEKGAMPFLHRYLGTPVISFIGRKSFGVQLSDFNCGMRAIKKSAYQKLNMQAPGMEYASEMIAKAGLQKMVISEVPVSLHKDGRERKPHLNTWRDGWKHLRLILLLSPKWLLLLPAFIFMLAGVVLSGLLLFSYIEVFNLILDIHTLYYASVFLMLAFQLLQFYIITRMYGSSMGLYPLRNFSKKILHFFTFEAGLILGGSIFLLGIALSFYAVNMWSQVHYGPLDPSYVFRIIIPAGFCIAVGMQLVVFGFLLHTIKHLQQRSLL